MAITAVAAAVTAAAAVAGTAMSVANAQSAAKLQKQQTANSLKAAGDQALQLQLGGVLGEYTHDIVQSQLGDQAVKNGLDRAALAITNEQLTQKRALLGAQVTRLRQDSDTLLTQVQTAYRGLDIQQGSVVADGVTKNAQTMQKAARDLGTMRAVAGEAGLAGSSMVAFAREIANVEGTNLSETSRETRTNLANLANERVKVALSAVSSMNDLGRRADQIVSDTQGTAADQQRAALQSTTIDIADRQISRDLARNDVDLEGKKAGLSAQSGQLESQMNNLQIQGSLISLQQSASLTSGVLGMIGSGAQIAGSYQAGVNKTAAEDRQMAALAKIATNSSR